MLRESLELLLRFKRTGPHCRLPLAQKLNRVILGCASLMSTELPGPCALHLRRLTEAELPCCNSL